jgi:hypothetical protein
VSSTYHEQAVNSPEYLRACTPCYCGIEGTPDESLGLFGAQYGDGPVEFHELIHNWRVDGQSKGLRFS